MGFGFPRKYLHNHFYHIIFKSLFVFVIQSSDQQQKYFVVANVDAVDANDVNDDSIDDHVMAEYASTHTYLDNILSRIDLNKDNLENNVEFPEFGRRLVISINNYDVDKVRKLRIVLILKHI